MVFFSILGTIFKIIGILLLGILLLLLFVLVLLLFVPLRYRAQFARGKEGIRVHAEVNYLFHFIHAPVDFCDGRLKIKFKVFGLTLYPKGKQREKKKDEEESEEKREEDLADQVKNQDSGMSEEDIGETQEKEECAGQEKTMQDGQDS
ncbi:MAG: hypothetical protein K2N63_01810, partial [Lachnospiraceae bacterium]|nr:hypothetical protein [Lachnospiraceae bacterium]